jgi:hypothetical protein
LQGTCSFQKLNVEPLASNPINQPTKSGQEDARLPEKGKINHAKISATRWNIIDINIGT